MTEPHTNQIRVIRSSLEAVKLAEIVSQKIVENSRGYSREIVQGLDFIKRV